MVSDLTSCESQARACATQLCQVDKLLAYLSTGRLAGPQRIQWMKGSPSADWSGWCG